MKLLFIDQGHCQTPDIFIDFPLEFGFGSIQMTADQHRRPLPLAAMMFFIKSILVFRISTSKISCIPVGINSVSTTVRFRPYSNDDYSLCEE